jgi:hypothetical protein
MTCETARFEQDARAFELFECHALDGATLPYGVYETPESQWTSDLTRQNAIENVIVISREGQLKGMAVY